MTDQVTRVVPAGWYDDPEDASLVRWWNGLTWTDHTERKPERAPAPAAVPVAAPAPALGWYGRQHAARG